MITLMISLFILGAILMLFSGIMAGLSLIFLFAKFGVIALVIWIIWKIFFD